jgi:hypothetical protein
MATDIRVSELNLIQSNKDINQIIVNDLETPNDVGITKRIAISNLLTNNIVKEGNIVDGAITTNKINSACNFTFNNATITSSIFLSGNIAMNDNCTVDGRDISQLGEKLDGIATGATACTGTVTCVVATAGDGISVTGSPITGAGTLTITNTSPNATHTGDVTGSTTLTIATNVVTNAKLADMPVNTIKGRIAAGTGDPQDLSAAQVRTILSVAPISAVDLQAVTTTGNTTTNSLSVAALNVFGKIIGGSATNTATGAGAAVLGGSSNKACAACSGILGGKNNTIIPSHTDSFIIGSDITSSAACTTFVNNLGVIGTVRTQSITACSNSQFNADPGDGSINNGFAAIRVGPRHPANSNDDIPSNAVGVTDRIYFQGGQTFGNRDSVNSDELWMGRANIDCNISELRINIGDDRSGSLDALAIGNSRPFASEEPQPGWLEQFRVCSNGHVQVKSLSFKERQVFSNPGNSVTFNGNCSNIWSTTRQGGAFTDPLTISNPENTRPGTYILTLATGESSTPRSVNYGNRFCFPGGVKPVLSTSLNMIDMIHLVVLDNNGKLYATDVIGYNI